MLYYGLASKQNILELSQKVCDCIGHGSTGFGVEMLVETCAAETLLGAAKDTTPYKAGAGVAQVDNGTFVWLRKKYRDHRIAKSLKETLGIDIGAAQYNELDLSPLLCLIFARLRYWTVTEPIPATLKERAHYWKQHYNTSEGKGTPEEYASRCISSGVESLLNQ